LEKEKEAKEAKEKKQNKKGCKYIPLSALLSASE